MVWLARPPAEWSPAAIILLARLATEIDSQSVAKVALEREGAIIQTPRGMMPHAATNLLDAAHKRASRLLRSLSLTGYVATGDADIAARGHRPPASPVVDMRSDQTLENVPAGIQKFLQ